MKPRTTLEDRNRLMAIPKTLTSDDGRVFRIRHWDASTGFDSSHVAIKIDALVEFEKVGPDPRGNLAP